MATVSSSGPLTPPGYRQRTADALMATALSSSPIVAVEGARGVGKSWTSLRNACSEVRLDRDRNAAEAAALWPARVLEGARPRLLDEWQLAPGLWNEARHLADAQTGRGLFIFTGSAHPPDDRTRHSGAGRVMRVRMRPMSLAESGESTGEASLRSLLDGADCFAGTPQASDADVVEALCRGGWPRHLTMGTAQAQTLCRAYLAEIARVDIARLDGARHRPEGVMRLLESLSRNIATAAAASTLADDIAGDATPSRDTVADYIEALKRVYVVEDLPAWSVHLRSRARLRRSPKRHLVDPSLAAAILGAGPERLWRDPGFLGQAFESLVVRDLRVYAEANEASVYHYRDSNGHELDAVVQCFDGRWLAVEVKLASADRIDEAARSLNATCEQIDFGRVGPPSKRLVITPSGYGYERADGVTVTPLTSLGP